MKTRVILLLASTILLLSCGLEGKSPLDTGTRGKQAATATERASQQTRGALSTNPSIDTRYEYADANGDRLVIENSLPRGGLTYTAVTGRKYRYAVFWTRIVNESATPVTLSIDVRADSFKIADAPATPFHWPKEAPAPAKQRPSLPDNYVKLVFPAEPMSPEKVPLFNYGLQDLKAALDHKLPQLSSLRQTIRPKDTGYIYVVVLANRGVAGVMRAGLSVKNDRLYYRVNDREIDCGHFTATSLTLQKVTQLAPTDG